MKEKLPEKKAEVAKNEASREHPSGTGKVEGNDAGVKLRDRLRKLMRDWGSHPTAPLQKNVNMCHKS